MLSIFRGVNIDNAGSAVALGPVGWGPKRELAHSD